MTSKQGVEREGGERRNDSTNAASFDEQLQIALAMSEQDMMDKTHENNSEEDDLERILKLSLTEK